MYIATPPGSHRDLALRVCAAGKPCYVEKPMARQARKTSYAGVFLFMLTGKGAIAAYKRVLDLYPYTQKPCEEVIVEASFFFVKSVMRGYAEAFFTVMVSSLQKSPVLLFHHALTHSARLRVGDVTCKTV